MSIPASGIDLALCTEEVIEAAFAGASYRMMSSRVNEADFGPAKSVSTINMALLQQQPTERKNVKIIFAIPQRSNWNFLVLPGAWRRIVMNLFGNALKFTESGFIRVCLTIEDIPSQQPTTGAEDSGEASSVDTFQHQASRLKLVISDSGIGISEEFLLNHVFKPFTQENPFYVGTGLGMSIVQQLVQSLNGTIHIKSKLQTGTEVQVEFPVYASKSPAASNVQSELQKLSAVIARLRQRKICVLEPANGLSLSENSKDGGFGRSLVDLLKKGFAVDAFHWTYWQEDDVDIVICTEPSFRSLADMRIMRRANRKVPVFIFVALDGIEASALRNDARVLSKESVVDIITQP
jgi:hypothetical protein